MDFIRNLWYVAAWTSELNEAPLGRTIIAEPIVLFRSASGEVVAMEDRCPHRHAPLSLGRVIGDGIQCMYHGLTLNAAGHCIGLPGHALPSDVKARVFPAVERDDWVWVWMGDPASADPGLIPEALGTTNPEFTMAEGAIDYEADYQLVNDNLTDLSHLDFVHETTLSAVTGAPYSTVPPKVETIPGGLKISRWFTSHPMMPGGPLVDSYNEYRYLLPGIFVMHTSFFPEGAAAAGNFAPPTGDPIFVRVEQQAVTPTGPKRTRYFYATGAASKFVTPGLLESMADVVNAAFAEDRRMIEAQQRIWDQTDEKDAKKAFLPQDKAPFLFRQLIQRRLTEEAA